MGRRRGGIGGCVINTENILKNMNIDLKNGVASTTKKGEILDISAFD